MIMHMALFVHLGEECNIVQGNKHVPALSACCSTRFNYICEQLCGNACALVSVHHKNKPRGMPSPRNRNIGDMGH